MWGGSGQDPGGTSSPPNQELMDLKDQFEQQQVLIAQLKEMLRKSEQTTITQEKVEEYANTLTRMSARAKKNKLKKGGDSDSKEETVSKKATTIDTPAKEKLMLLRQQVEENKQKLAERGKFQKDIEETVTQLKAQLADSQQLISQTPLNLSLTEPKTENYSVNSGQEELFNLVVSRDRRITELNTKIQKLEANVLDLQENVKEKDSVIDARTKAITLMTESLSRKGKNTLDALDDTKEQMRKMQENFVTLEMEMKNEKEQLLLELEQKNNEIDHLRQANDVLEKTCGEQRDEIVQLNDTLAKYKSVESDEANRTIIEDLNGQIEVLNNRIKELEEANIELQVKPADTSSRDSPQRSSKKGKKGQKAQKAKSKEGPDDLEVKVSDLQKLLDKTKEECEGHLNKITEYELMITDLNLQIEELKVKPSVKVAEVVQGSEEVAKLKKQLDESNKSMIKIKAQHKAKIKELNKKIEELKKGGDNEEVLKLQVENSRLSERIDMLEEEKVNLGLDVDRSAHGRGATERINELEIKLMEKSDLLDSKDKAITALEEQINSNKIEMAALSERFEKLSQLENAQVVSEITSIHFEEQVDKLEMEKRELLEEKQEMIRDKQDLLEKLDVLVREKQDISNKLDSYMQENMELIDKLEKLSAEKVSSAESIEIVEGLTQQEKLELEAYQKSLEMVSGSAKHSNENLEENPELNESVNQLTEETSDLLRKIELFTEERREVMEKMEILTNENNQLNIKIHEIENNRDVLAETYEQLQNEKEDLENQMKHRREQIEELEVTLDHLKQENNTLKEKLADDQEIKHGSEVEETVNLETVAPLQSSAKEYVSVELEKQIEEFKALVEIQKQEIQELKVQLLSQRDLSETNRELQESISSLKIEYESLLSENKKLSQAIEEADKMIQEKGTAETEFNNLKKQMNDEIEQYKTEIEQYKQSLISNTELTNDLQVKVEREEKEKIVLESELNNLRERLNEFDGKIIENLNDIEHYKTILEDQKDLLTSKSNLADELQSNLREKELEISEYKAEVSHLNSVMEELRKSIALLEDENQRLNKNSEAVDVMSSQLQELKGVLVENIKQIELYESELQQNSEFVEQLKSQLNNLNRRLLEMNHDLECKDDEIKKLIKERENKETMIANLQRELKEKDENFHQVCNDLKEKYLTLQKQIDQNADSMKSPISKISELEAKNKEQLDKMKKIAASLKKKTAAYHELEQQYKQTAEKWETEGREKVQLQELVQTQEVKLVEAQNKIDSLLDQLLEMEKELTVVQDALAAKTDEANALVLDLGQIKAENEELLGLNKGYELQLSTLTAQAELSTSDESNKLNMEINEKNEVIKNLNQELETVRYNSETSTNALHAKIQELEMFIETQETELTKYKEKVNRLEEGLSSVEERRLSLEQKTIELGVQLQEKSNSYEEISQTEDILEQRLAALMVHDEKVERHLQETMLENQELAERNRFLMEENDQLKHKLSAATERNLDASINEEKLRDLQSENLRLNNLVVNLDGENKRLHTDYEKKLFEKKSEIETMEVELQGQLEQLDNERKTLVMQCEQLQDQVKEYDDNQELLKEEIDQYKLKLEQQESDNQLHLAEFQQVSTENENNLELIKQLKLELSELSELDNSSKKVVQLEKVLMEKDVEIENYRKQNLQLQMQGTFGHAHEFDSFTQQSPKTSLEELQKSNDELSKLNLELQTKIETLQKQQHSESKTTESHQTPATKQIISTFTWPEQSDDPFAFVEASPASIFEPVVQQEKKMNIELHQEPTQNLPVVKHSNENTYEELLKKIKTLEFMLYNTEKEKEDVLHQCQDLTHEIARLIFQHQKAGNPDLLQSGIQLCLEDSKESHQQRKEYKNVHAQTMPAVEEVIEATASQLLYKPEAPLSTVGISPFNLQMPEAVALESQIISATETTISQDERKRLQELEFEQSKPPVDTKVGKELKPVEEDRLQPKTAYLCFQLEDLPENQPAEINQEGDSHHSAGVTKVQPILEDVVESVADKMAYVCFKPSPQVPEASTSAITSIDVFDENDDGWGCGVEEAKLEEDHRRQMERPCTDIDFHSRMEEMDERIRVLELERERHLDTIKIAHVKSGKMIKKLREFKALNDKLQSELKRTSDFGGLDDAIQDELQAQIVQLERRIKECSAELEKEKVDKSNLLKKIDVLQAANERMVEMKEKQDVELMLWKQQNRELSAKLEQFEWGDGGFDSPKHAKSDPQSSAVDTDIQNYEKKIQNLNNTIKELTLDNEELQVMLEEQRALRMNAEKSKSVEPIPENMKSETEYLSIVTERNYLNEQLVLSVEEKKHLQEQLNNFIKENGELQQKMQSIEDGNFKSSARTHQLEQELQLMETSISTQSDQLDQANAKIVDLEKRNLQLTDSLQSLQMTTQKLTSENAELLKLSDSTNLLQQEKSELSKTLHEQNVDVEKLKEKVTECENKKMELEQMLSELKRENESKLIVKESEFADLTNKLEVALGERDVLSASIQQLVDEWSQRVDQRGADVAESWKLHLEARESEFTQIEQQLRKELNDLEEKCNALVNENNELRKNVDAEIRNEVDKISALQQQINDRQRIINNLTVVVQENQAEMDKQQHKLTEYEETIMKLNGKIQEKDVKITKVEANVLSLQIEIEEKCKIIEELEEVQQQLHVNQKIMRELQNDLKAKQEVIDEYTMKANESNVEARQYKEHYELIQKQIQDKDLYIAEITKHMQNIQTQKDSEANNAILVLQQQLLEKSTQIEMLNQQIHSYQQDGENLQAKSIQINELTAEISKLQADIQEKLAEIKSLKETVDMQHTEIVSLQIEVGQLKLILSEKEKEYAHNLLLASQESETVFHEKAQELDIFKRRQAETESRYEELLAAKESDMKNLRLQLEQQMQRNELLSSNHETQEATINEFKNQLELKQQECGELHKNVLEQDVLHDEENKQLAEMREIIEDQVLKIESLKMALFEKSKDYDSLIAELDIRKPRSEPETPPPLEQQEEFMKQLRASDVRTPTRRKSSAGDDVPNRAEMDLALYMLHQRDMRCEELTVELMQLLEERDTLQLKLSNTIREKEELRKRFLPLSVTPENTERNNAQTPSTPTGAIPKSKSKTSAIVFGAMGTELATEATEQLLKEEDSDRLATKLSELKSVGYRRDKTLLDEQDQRRLQQLALMQQHRDVAAMLPAEAAAKLVQDANYTLSRDVQSPPRVLLNWLWGKSTPKVNDV